MDPLSQLEASAERRTELAEVRTVLAAERTYAAWIRTGLAALASGIAAKPLLAGIIPAWALVAVGTVFTILSAFCFGAGIWRELFPGVREARPTVKRMPTSMLVPMSAILMLVAVVALITIWFVPTPER